MTIECAQPKRNLLQGRLCPGDIARRRSDGKVLVVQRNSERANPPIMCYYDSRLYAPEELERIAPERLEQLLNG